MSNWFYGEIIMKEILIAGNDPKFLLNLQKSLVNEQYKIVLVSTDSDFRPELSDTNADLVILDLDRVDETILQLCEEVRTYIDAIPLMALIQEPNTDEVIDLLDVGVDLSLEKPFATPELIARIRALLRRHGGDSSWDDPTQLFLEPRQRMVRINQRHIKLTRMEFVLLSYLCQDANNHHSAQELLKEVWKYPKGTGDTALVRNHIRNLRNKLEEDPERPRIVESLPKRGYRINANIQWMSSTVKT